MCHRVIESRWGLIMTDLIWLLKIKKSMEIHFWYLDICLSGRLFGQRGLDPCTHCCYTGSNGFTACISLQDRKQRLLGCAPIAHKGERIPFYSTHHSHANTSLCPSSHAPHTYHTYHANESQSSEFNYIHGKPILFLSGCLL